MLEEYQLQRQAMSRFFLGAMILSDPVLAVVRRELRRMSPDVKIDVEEIRTALTEEVLKREVLEGERAEDARKKIAKMLRSRAQKDTETEETPTVVPTPSEQPAHPPSTQAEGSDVRPGS